MILLEDFSDMRVGDEYNGTTLIDGVCDTKIIYRVDSIRKLNGSTEVVISGYFMGILSGRWLVCKDGDEIYWSVL